MIQKSRLNRLERERLAKLQELENRVQVALAQLTDSELDLLILQFQGYDEPLTPEQVAAAERWKDLGLFQLTEEIERLMTPAELANKKAEWERIILESGQQVTVNWDSPPGDAPPGVKVIEWPDSGKVSGEDTEDTPSAVREDI